MHSGFIKFVTNAQCSERVLRPWRLTRGVHVMLTVPLQHTVCRVSSVARHHVSYPGTQQSLYHKTYGINGIIVA
jgi:hypothetical protein